jgi:benzoyl-CoA reductase/2-hydroxyglutaryl-CoA dehydratase subunit BcrC/BadD/HgdB
VTKDVYEEFLRITGFEDEIPAYLPEWKKASAKLGLTPEDVSYATEERIPEHFDTSLRGVRKALCSTIKETIDLTKASDYKKQGIKIVNGILPAISVFYYALKMTAPDKVYVAFPDIFLTQVLNGLFHKLNPYLEEAERTGIPYGCRHCALNKTRYAARRMNIIPSPDISWIWGFICDEGPKTDELINCHHDPDWKTYITRIPHDQPLGTVEDENISRIEYLASQMKDGFEYVQKEIGIKVTEEKIAEVQSNWRRYTAKVAELNRLMVSEPIPLGGLDGRIFTDVLNAPYNTGFEPMEEALDIIITEVKQRVAEKKGAFPEGTPKLMSMTISLAMPWVTKIFEENGVALLFRETGVASPKQLTPLSFQDPYMAAAEAWLRYTTHVNPGYRAELIIEKTKTLDMDGIVFGFFDFDRWIGSDHRLLAKMVEKRTNIPVFYLEGDAFDDRDYSPEALRTRIESICEIIKMKCGRN